MYPLLRIALALCNLSTDKIEDGIGKLLTKADVTRLASKAQAHVARECEDALLKAKQIVKMLEMQDDGTLMAMVQ